MKWEKLVEREGDFLKNCLLYENFIDNFPKKFQRNHSNFLTVRKGNIFIHYWDIEDSSNTSLFIKEQLQKDPDFMEKIVREGKEHFVRLVKFSEQIHNLDDASNKELAKLAGEYFRLYKEPYPNFNLTVFAHEFEKEGNMEIVNLMANWRLFARDHFNKTHSLIKPLFEEIGKRLNFSVEQVRFLKPNEIIEALLLESKIKNRNKCYFILKDGKFELHEDKSYFVEELISNEVRGQGTFPAKYKGRVKVIQNNDDLKNIEKGNVLVLRMTTPDLMLEKIREAGSIITDEGGITCHAAVISREFNIPTLMGTRSATRVFSDGDMVEVDTELGVANKVNDAERAD